MEKKKKHFGNVKWMVQVAILLAVMIVLGFTPLGYLKVGAIEITLMVLPVAVGAVVLGPLAGAILGGFFGLTSFIQCFGMSVFGTLIFSISPIGAFVTCMIPRILCGWLSGLIFQVFRKVDKTKLLSIFAGSLSTAVLNTLFFMTALLLLFWKSPAFTDTMASWGVATESVGAFLIVFIGVNGVVEALVNVVAATAISKVLLKINTRE